MVVSYGNSGVFHHVRPQNANIPAFEKLSFFVIEVKESLKTFRKTVPPRKRSWFLSVVTSSCTTYITVKIRKFGYPKIAVIILKFELRYYHTLLCLKEAGRESNSVVPDQTVCPACLSKNLGSLPH